MAEPITPGTDTEATQSDRTSSRLVSATAIMAAGTALSRILGFVRVALLAAALGATTHQANMFTYATVIPQAIYMLLAGGVLNTVFVPQIVRAMQEDADGGEAYTNRLLTLALSTIGLITIGATAAAPVIMGDIYLDPMWKNDPDLAGQYESLITLTYLCLPQIFFYGVHVMVGQVLNARGKFGPMMWAPIANNLVGIVTIVTFIIIWQGPRDLNAPFTLGQELLLGIGATLGIALQALVLVPFLHSVGYRFRPRFDFRGSGLGRAAQVAKWTVGYMIVTQIAVTLVGRLASGTGGEDGGAGWAAYTWANLLFILPHSLITVSLTTAMLPSTSRLVQAGDLAGAAREAMQTMRLAITALLPASVAYLALAFPITHLLFGNRAAADNWQPVAWTLMAFAVGLVPFTLQYVCLRTFFALEDTRTTFLVQILIASVNIGAAYALVLPFQAPQWVAVGLAGGYSIAYLVGLGVSFHRLGKHLPELRGAEIVRHCVRVLVAVLPAGAAAWAIAWGIGQWSTSKLALIGTLACSGVVAVGIFLAMSRVLHIAEVNQILSTLTRRLGRGSGGNGPTGGSSGGGPSGDPPPSDSPAVGAATARAAETSGTIGGGTTTAGLTPGGPGAGAGEEASTGSQIREQDRGRSDFPAGQQRMTGGQAKEDSSTRPVGPAEERPGDAEIADTNPGPRTDDSARVDDPAAVDPDQTAEFSWEELTADPGPEAASAAAADNPEQLPAGAVLGSRYRLEELLAWTGASNIWRAFDQVLSRSVVVHLLPIGDDRSSALLAAGRKAAGATDSRFLRILDAIEEGGTDREGRPVGTYIVSEYSVGQSLQSVVKAAPLTGLEAAWVVREVADALASVHPRGIHHGLLNPETVVITPSGNVKIVGLMIEAALRPDAPVGNEPDPAKADVADLGRLLYACLVARWPGDPGEVHHGLPQAPEAHGLSQHSAHPWLTPRQVRHGVSPTLDRICNQLLSPRPRHQAPQITEAAALVGELDRVLGPADATGDLERRLRHPQPGYLAGDLGEEGDQPRTTVGPQPAETYALVERTSSVAAGTNPHTASPASAPAAAGSAAADPATKQPPAEPIRVGSQRYRGPRGWVWVLVILLLLLAVVAAYFASRGIGSPGTATPPSTGPGQTQAAPPEPQPVEIAEAQDFDPPPGGNGEEHPEDVEKAYDGDPESRWTTMEYYGDPKFGGLPKDGVGLVLDLGEPVPLNRVNAELSGDGTDLEIRVPQGDAGSTDDPDMDDLESWRTVAQQQAAGETAQFDVEDEVTTRYVLVLLTSLPEEGGDYRGGIYEVEVLS